MPATLRFRDGFDTQRPEVREDVAALQRSLIAVGYSLLADGRFGEQTRAALKAFQRVQGLKVDGVAGPLTRGTLKRAIVPETDIPDTRSVAGLESFGGDLRWVHAREGHVGRAYWPGGSSGVTFDPGFDLGHQDEASLARYYGDILTETQHRAAVAALRSKGRDARDRLRESPALKTIKVDRRQAFKAMPLIASPYWQAISKRFPNIVTSGAPASVHTVMLSLAYNRGGGNPGLRVLEEPIAQADWAAVGKAVANMQQDHPLRGIQIRRRLESELILAQVGNTTTARRSTLVEAIVPPAPPAPAAGAPASKPPPTPTLADTPRPAQAQPASATGQPDVHREKGLERLAPRRYRVKRGEIVTLRIVPIHEGALVSAAIGGHVLTNVGELHEPIFRFRVDHSPTFARLVYRFSATSGANARYEVHLSGSSGDRCEDEPITRNAPVDEAADTRVFYEFEAAAAASTG